MPQKPWEKYQAEGPWSRYAPPEQPRPNVLPQAAPDYRPGVASRVGREAILGAADALLPGGEQIDIRGQDIAGVLRHPLIALKEIGTGLLEGVGQMTQATPPTPEMARARRELGDVNRTKELLPSRPLELEEVAHGGGAVAATIGASLLGSKKGRAAAGAATEAVVDAPGNLLNKVGVTNRKPSLPKAVDEVFRAANPSAGNLSFRDNLDVALPDLAEVQRATPLKAKGNARIREFTKNVKGYASELYAKERGPQIVRHADVPVSVKLSSGTLEAVSDILDRPVRQSMTLAEMDAMAKEVNTHLRAFEQMTPENKLVAKVTRPKIDALKQADVAFGKEISEVLERFGEAGVKDFDRRYAALKSVQRAFEAQVNPAEKTRLLKHILEAPTTMASARRAIVAGREMQGATLQRGLDKLAKSDLKPVIPQRKPNPQKLLPARTGGARPHRGVDITRGTEPYY